MGMYAHVEYGLSQRTWDDVARKVGLPETIADDCCCYLTARAAMQADAILDQWFSSYQEGNMISLQELHCINAMQFVVRHATDYISNKALEVDRLISKGELDKKDRKNWLRKQTKAYRLVFA